ncbi:sulfatase [Niabella terrae]
MKFVFVFLLALPFYVLAGEKPAPPNILFCLADDWGWPFAGAYGDKAIKTPNFDRLAREGVLFEHAFVSSPSCTPSRNSFLTGKYHWQLQSGANLWSTLPEKHQSFIHLLNAQGYLIGRTKAKTWGPGSLDNWIAAHGKHPSGKGYNSFRDFLDSTQAGQKPFFFWLGTADPHRPYVKGSGAKSGIDLSDVFLFDHYPESDIVRSDVADYYFEVQRWDRLVGKAIDELERRGLLDNTIIIMTGDHGMPFPRCKGNLYDSGVRVPFAVRWGSVVATGRQVEDFISFADIAPTLLEAAGVRPPADMTGRSFLDLLQSEKSGWIDSVHRSDVVFGRERHTLAQERPSQSGYPSRAYRTRDFLYIRNYEPDLWPAGTWKESLSTVGRYADCDNGPTKNYILDNKDKNEELHRIYQLCFAKRPAEELYDLNKDPGQLRNLASLAPYKKQLQVMRDRLQKKLDQLEDPRARNPHYQGFYEYPYLGNSIRKN